jgi:spermidine/putrescine ABC transporter ATP-binding subunit
MQQAESPDMIAAAGRSGALELSDLTKSFSALKAVDRISLTVGAGEFITFLGPSGSGKTTTLRMVAGFMPLDGGTIWLDGQDISHRPPHRRDIGMVFQNYALFPHMTVAKNLAFPLEMRGWSRSRIREEVEKVLAMVRLSGFADRLPRQLSGGQQQRVALARAVIFKPPLLLMDEPLGALDKKLRDMLQLEILELRRQLATTIIYVTHDQEEALAMSDRIAIFNGGRIEQCGTTRELYERPANLFVANFIGDSNRFRGRIDRDPTRILGEGWTAVIPTSSGGSGEATIVVRPERLRLGSVGQATEPGWNRRGGRLREAIYLGSMMKYVVDLPDGDEAIVRNQMGQEGRDLTPGTAVELLWDPAHSIVLRQ